MAAKESKEIARAEQPRSLQTLLDIDAMFDEFFRRPFSVFGLPRLRFPETAELTPTVDIYEEKGDVVVKAELPGINKEDLDVTVSEDTITIAGERRKKRRLKNLTTTGGNAPMVHFTEHLPFRLRYRLIRSRQNSRTVSLR